MTKRCGNCGWWGKQFYILNNCYSFYANKGTSHEINSHKGEFGHKQFITFNYYCCRYWKPRKERQGK